MTETPRHYLSSFEGASTRTPARGVLAQTRVAPRRRRDRRPSSVGGGAMAPASRAREAERALLHSVRCGSFADVRNALDVVDAVPGASVDARGFADVLPCTPRRGAATRASRGSSSTRGRASSLATPRAGGRRCTARCTTARSRSRRSSSSTARIRARPRTTPGGASTSSPTPCAARGPSPRARTRATRRASVRDRPSRGGPPPPPPPRRLLAPWICTRGAAA